MLADAWLRFAFCIPLAYLFAVIARWIPEVHAACAPCGSALNARFGALYLAISFCALVAFIPDDQFLVMVAGSTVCVGVIGISLGSLVGCHHGLPIKNRYHSLYGSPW